MISLNHLGTHPLADKFHELMTEIEKLPGDVKQTALVRDLSDLRTKTENLLNDPDFKTKMESLI